MLIISQNDKFKGDVNVCILVVSLDTLLLIIVFSPYQYTTFRNDKQETPLVCAICAGSNEIVKLLIEVGADTDVDHGDEVN